MEHKVYTIDVTGKVLGRLASEIALLLRGKRRTSFVPYQDHGDEVVVKNVAKICLTGKKLAKKKYFHHTGYLGNLKEISLEKMFRENPALVLKKAVFDMLPKNKLRAKQIKRLTFV